MLQNFTKGCGSLGGGYYEGNAFLAESAICDCDAYMPRAATFKFLPTIHDIWRPNPNTSRPLLLASHTSLLVGSSHTTNPVPEYVPTISICIYIYA